MTAPLYVVLKKLNLHSDENLHLSIESSDVDIVNCDVDILKVHTTDFTHEGQLTLHGEFTQPGSGGVF